MKEFLANGGEIQKIPAVQPELSTKVNSTAKKIPQLKTLSEGQFLYAENKKKAKKKKEPDYSNINMDLIPDNIKKLINYSDQTSEDKQSKKEDNVETNKNS